MGGIPHNLDRHTVPAGYPCLHVHNGSICMGRTILFLDTADRVWKLDGCHVLGNVESSEARSPPGGYLRCQGNRDAVVAELRGCCYQERLISAAFPCR